MMNKKRHYANWIGERRADPKREKRKGGSATGAPADRLMEGDKKRIKNRDSRENDIEISEASD